VSFPRAASKSDRVVIKGAKDCVDGAIARINEIVSDLVSVLVTVCNYFSYSDHRSCYLFLRKWMWYMPGSLFIEPVSQSGHTPM